MENHNKTNTYYRATTLIIERSYKDNERPTIILFKNKKWEVYVNPGGRIDGKVDDMNLNQILIRTAMRELQEETSNLIDLDNNIYATLEHINIYNNVNKKYYRAFLLPINGNIIDKSIYYQNNDMIANHPNVDIDWRETTDIKRFYLDELMAHSENVNSEYFNCEDVDGNYQKVYHFVINELNEFNSNGLINQIMENSQNTVEWFNLRLDEYKCVTNNFLFGTKTYTYQ